MTHKPATAQELLDWVRAYKEHNDHDIDEANAVIDACERFIAAMVALEKRPPGWKP